MENQLQLPYRLTVLLSAIGNPGQEDDMKCQVHMQEQWVVLDIPELSRFGVIPKSNQPGRYTADRG